MTHLKINEHRTLLHYAVIEQGGLLSEYVYTILYNAPIEPLYIPDLMHLTSHL
jgi:hypothetical protein